MGNFASRQRTAEEVSLDGVAAEFPESLRRFLIPDALGDTGDAEHLGELDG